MPHVSRVHAGVAASGSAIASPTQTHTAGNLLVALVSFGQFGVFDVIDDLGGNTWHLAGSELLLNSNRFRIYYAYNCLGFTNNVVTAHFSTPDSYRTIVVHEFSGNGASDPLNDFDSATGSGVAIATPTLTLVAALEVIVAYMVANGGNISNSAGFNLVNFAATGDAVPYFADEYKITSSSEPAVATCDSAGWGIIAATFKFTSGGGGPVSISPARQVRVVSPIKVFGV